MKPILFSIGQVHIYSFGLMIALGVFVSLQLMSRRVQQVDFLSKDKAFDLVFVVLLTGFLGGRLAYVVQYREWYMHNPLKIFTVWEGGLIFYGGVIGAILGLLVFIRIKKYPGWEVFDFLLPYVALTHAFGRIGCLLNGCCYGKVCDLPWGLHLPNHEQPLHPTQAYEAIFAFGLFLFLNNFYSKQKKPGQVTLLYFSFYAVGRFIIEFFRDDNPYVFGMTWNQWLGIVILCVVFIIFYLKRKKESIHASH